MIINLCDRDIAILTDRLTDGINPLEFNSSFHQYRRIYRRIDSVGISYTHRRHYRQIFSVGNYNITDEIKIRRYISSRNLFFSAQISSKKPSGNDFFVFPTDIPTKWRITDEGKADRRNPSAMTSVKKSPTNL